MKRIVIIGAGAAGLMAATTLLEASKECDFHIDFFEKNTSPGKKILISGGGRCNVTTSITDKKILATKYTRGWDFIKKSIGKFWPQKTFEWFERHGVPLKTQEDQRVFPQSDDGHDIVGVFTDIFRKYTDTVHLHWKEGVTHVTSVVQENRSSLFQVSTQQGVYEADIVIITTGGNAYAHTGSTGDGYTFARNMGHTITPLGPSLSSFLLQETWLTALSGLALEKARIGFYKNNISHEEQGSLLVTHFWISWPLAFMISSQLAWEDVVGKTIHLAPTADMYTSDWEAYLKSSFSEHPKKFITSLLAERTPRRWAEAFVAQYCPHLKDTFVSSIPKKDRQEIANLLGRGIPLTLMARRPGDEFVTAWGVNTDEIDPETLESKIQKNLYFAGEILNVDGYTGGFSLQICWSTGYQVGKSIKEKIN